MTIRYSPKTGEVLSCDFGSFITNQAPPSGYKSGHFAGRIPPEMVKHRMVVVLHGKLNNACLVVPISSSQDLGGISRGFHIPIAQSFFPLTSFLDQRDRWAKADLIQHVSKDRLFKLRDSGRTFDLHLPRDVVTEIQRAVIRCISATALISK